MFDARLNLVYTIYILMDASFLLCLMISSIAQAPECSYNNSLKPSQRSSSLISQNRMKVWQMVSDSTAL